MLLEAPTLSAIPRIRHAFFTREGGVSAGVYASLNGGPGSRDAAENVRENRARMAAALGVDPAHLLTPYQTHSPAVAVADAPWDRASAPRADAVVTRVPGLAVGVTTADCGPVLFADTRAGVVGAAHAGWKGALTGVLEATLQAMERLGGARWRMAVALGPMIRQPNYEVGPEFMQRFRAEAPDNTEFFVPAPREGHARFDLAGYIRRRLLRAGITTVDDLGLCTYADPARFFSYRRGTHAHEPDYGRHISAIVLAE
jgi:YfiH family protein